MLTLRFLPRLALALVLMLASVQQLAAQPSGARGDDFIYRVLRDDTLIDLSNRFTGTASNWPTLRDLNTVSDPAALPIGLELRIPFTLIPQVPAQAQVVHASGQVLLNNTSLQRQDVIGEGDVLLTRSDGFVTLQLPDASVSSLPSDSTVNIRRLREFMGTGLIDIIFDLESGAVESTVAPEGTGTGRYEIRTPVSITGVRGTRLRVRTDSDGSRTEVLSGTAQLGRSGADGPRVGANQGAVVSDDGRMLPVRALLPTPVLNASTDEPVKNAIHFDPVPGAVAYLVRVSADRDGTRPVSAETIGGPPARFRAPGSGTWYVTIRAIDDLGLMSDDAVHQFEGRQTLQTAFGLMVGTGFGHTVALSDY